MYVAVIGERAIDNAHLLLAKQRRGDTAVPNSASDQVRANVLLP